MSNDKGTQLSRRKGFSVSLTNVHWLCVRQAIEWLANRKLLSAAHTEAAKLLPDLNVDEGLGDDMIGGRAEWWDIHRAFNGSTSVRIRAADVPDVKALLIHAASMIPHPSYATTVYRRAERLADIPLTDLLADTAR